MSETTAAPDTPKPNEPATAAPDSYSTQSTSGNDHPDPSRWWKFRREGMHTGVRWGIIQTFMWAALGMWDAIYGNPESPALLNSFTAVIAWSYGLCLILIVGYYSNTAIDEVVRNRLVGR